MTLGNAIALVDENTYFECLDVNGARISVASETFSMIPSEWTVKRIWVEEDDNLKFSILCLQLDGDFTDFA